MNEINGISEESKLLFVTSSNGEAKKSRQMDFT